MDCRPQMHQNRFERPHPCEFGRAASTVSREIARHGGRSSYRANKADDGAWDSALRPKPCLLALNRKLRNDAVSIRERPAEVEDRAVPGHWEGDLISGTKNSHIVTLVERQSRYTALVKVANRETATVVAALTRQIRRLPTSLRRSLTWDRGHEMAKHKLFTVATNVKVYFCDPCSPWQRGSNENTNGLLRQYFPKGTDLSGYTQADLDKVALRLNQRPRETLGFQTPAVKLRASVALTH
jgi:IS30 family transposase